MLGTIRKQTYWLVGTKRPLADFGRPCAFRKFQRMNAAKELSELKRSK
jgi:hypothetical protein